MWYYFDQYNQYLHVLNYFSTDDPNQYMGIMVALKGLSLCHKNLKYMYQLYPIIYALINKK